MDDESEESEGTFIRIDFKQTVLDMDEATHVVRFVMEPDPRRYDRTERDGKTYWRDKYFNFEFGVEVLKQTAESAPGTPIFVNPKTIEVIDDYAQHRRQAIQQEHLGGGYTPPTETPAKRRDLEATGGGKPVTFVSVDIVGSTRLRAQHNDAYDRVHRTFLRELIVTIGQFGGSVLKTTGDGFIAFFDGPSINTQADAAIDACMSLQFVLEHAINAAAETVDLPFISIRVGADHGNAAVVVREIPEVGFSEQDILSDAINRAVKLQEAASPGGVLIGRGLYECLHFQWLERCEEDARLDVKPGGYRTYRVR